MTHGTVWSEDIRTQGSISRSAVLIIQTDGGIVCHHGAGSKVSHTGETLVHLGHDIYRQLTRNNL